MSRKRGPGDHGLREPTGNVVGGMGERTDAERGGPSRC